MRREDPAGRLIDQLHDPSVGEGALLVVGGAGMGKTHLLHRVATSLRASGGQVGWCQCNQLLGGPPLWEWRSAIGEIVGELDESFPGSDGLEVFQTIWGTLERAGRERPTLLVLDDLHDASPSTVELLQQVARRPRTSPWMVVAAARNEDEAVRSLNIARRSLAGIDPSEAVQIAATLGIELTDERAGELVHFTGGNPLFVRRMLETGTDRLEMTAELLTLMQSLVDDIDDAIRPVVEALSVLGTSAQRPMLRAVVGSDRWPSMLASDQTIWVDREEISFRHPLVREVIYKHLTDEERSALHARAAEANEELAGSVSLAAVHWSRASLAGQGRAAADTALRAGHLAMDMGAWSDAVGHFAHASAVLERLNDLDDRAASGVYRSRALSLDGDIDGALRAILDSIPDQPAQIALEHRRLLVRELVRLRWREEPNPSVLASGSLLRIADVLLGEESDAVSRSIRAAATVTAGELEGLEQRHADVAASALDGLSHDVAPVIRGEAHLALRRALMAVPGSRAERIGASQAAVDAARESGDVELIGRSLRMLLTDALSSANRPLALSTLAAFDTAATSALREHQALAQAGMASLEGRYTDASDLLDDAAKELAYVGRDAPSLEFVRVAMLDLDQGGLSASLATYEPLLAVVADPSLRAAFAFSAAAEGDHRRAGELIDGVLEIVGDAGSNPLRPVSVAMAAEAAALIGHESCERFLVMLEPAAGSCSTPSNAAVPWLGSVDRLIGLLRARLGDLDGAESAIRASLTTHRAMRARPWTARSLVALAAVLHSSGRNEEAALHDEEAATLQRELGMGPLPVCDFADAPIDVSATTATESRPRSVRLERADRGWLLRVGDQPGHLLPNLTGLQQLALLVAQPGREWHVIDLAGATAGASVVASDGGPMIDDAARRAYQERMAGLRSDLDEAEERADVERASKITLEIDALESELLAAFGLGGRSRRLDDRGERARVNARRNLTRAMDAIEQVDRSLGDHLRHRVVTGRFCSYRPSMTEPIDWSVSVDG